MKTLFKVTCVVVGIMIFIGLFRIGYLWLTYIDDTITSGEGYGFNIGETKEQIFDKAIKIFQDENIYILNSLDGRGYRSHEEFEFTSEDYELLKNRNKWEFYYAEGYFDSIKLTFEQDRLVEIYRHRKKFELP